MTREVEKKSTDQNVKNRLFYFKFDKQIEPIAYESSLTIKFTSAGLDYYRVGSKEHKLKPNQFMTINNDSEVSAFTNKTSEGMSLFIDQDIVNEVATAWSSPQSQLDQYSSGQINFSEFPQYCDTELGLLLSNIFTEIAVDSKNQLKTDIGFFYMIAEYMVKSQAEVDSRLKGIPRLNSSVRIEIYRRVMLAREFIDENYGQDLSLSQLSKVAGMSKYYFIRSFEHAYGITPHKYVLIKRIEKAKELLYFGQLDVSSVSTKIGFSDVHSFSKTFKRLVGITPTDFIEKNRKIFV